VGRTVPQQDLTNFAGATGDQALTAKAAQNGGSSSDTTADSIDFIYTNGWTPPPTPGETAMDVEYSHGVATHAHLRYWLGDQTGVCPNCGGTMWPGERHLRAANDPQSMS